MASLGPNTPEEHTSYLSLGESLTTTTPAINYPIMIVMADPFKGRRMSSPVRNRTLMTIVASIRRRRASRPT